MTDTKKPKIGRPRKADKDHYVQITCMLRRDTVERLKAGAGSPFFSKLLQFHLDRFPIPTRDEWLALLSEGGFATVQIKRHRKVPVIVAGGDIEAARRQRSGRAELVDAQTHDFIEAVLERRRQRKLTGRAA